MSLPSIEEILRALDDRLDEMLALNMRTYNCSRWFALIVNLICASVYLIPPYKTWDFFAVPFHIAIGFGVFFFITRTYREHLRQHAIRKLKRGRVRWED